MALSARSVSSFDVEQDGVQLGGGAGGAPARPEAGASGFEEVVDVFEFLGEQLVVVAEFEQLRVGVLEQLDGGLGAGVRVVDKGGVPSDDGEVVRIVGDAGLQNFLALAVGERGSISPRTTCAIWSRCAARSSSARRRRRRSRARGR